MPSIWFCIVYQMSRLNISTRHNVAVLSSPSRIVVFVLLFATIAFMDDIAMNICYIYQYTRNIRVIGLGHLQCVEYKFIKHYSDSAVSERSRSWLQNVLECRSAWFAYKQPDIRGRQTRSSEGAKFSVEVGDLRKMRPSYKYLET